MVSFKINGETVQARQGWTVLETARQHGVHIPTLCHHEAVEPSGACRLCVVEVVQGKWSKIVISCMYPVAEGIEILTDSPRVKNVRRWILEMLLAECPGSKEIRALAAEYGVSASRFAAHHPDEQCILCGLCVRVCKEVVGVSAISTIGRGVHKKIGSPYQGPAEACVACGSCVTVCPTGAMRARLDAVRGEPKVKLAHGAK
ncbi:MAG: (2Fe-2S)-binding protein [Desulfarculus sp.]|nr:(2Fe-2S)-binding protein [Desulfarculus sp.]